MILLWTNRPQMTLEMQFRLIHIHPTSFAKKEQANDNNWQAILGYSIQNVLVIIILLRTTCIKTDANKWNHQRYTLLQGVKRYNNHKQKDYNKERELRFKINCLFWGLTMIIFWNWNTWVLGARNVIADRTSFFLYYQLISIWRIKVPSL